MKPFVDFVQFFNILCAHRLTKIKGNIAEDRSKARTVHLNGDKIYQSGMSLN